MLGGEGPGGGHALDIGQQQAARGQRNNSLDIAQPQRGTGQRGQAGRDLSRHGHPERRQPEQRGNGNRQRDNAERDRLSRQQPLTVDDQQDRDDADGANQQLNLAELPGKQKNPFEKIVAAALHAEQAWQLGHGDGQAGAGLETHQDAVADQFYQRAQAQQPGEQAEQGDREGGEAGDLGVALRVACGHRPHRAGDHQRDGGSGPDRELARGSEQGIAQTAQQIAVDADLRRQACKSRIGQRNRDRVGRKRYPGHNIAGQPGRAVFGQPACRRKPRQPGHLLSFVSRICHALSRAPDCPSIKYQPPPVNLLDFRSIHSGRLI